MQNNQIPVKELTPGDVVDLIGRSALNAGLAHAHGQQIARSAEWATIVSVDTPTYGKHSTITAEMPDGDQLTFTARRNEAATVIR